MEVVVGGGSDEPFPGKTAIKKLRKVYVRYTLCIL